MGVIGNLSVQVTANTEKFSRGMKTARKDLSNFEKGLSATKGILIGFGVALATQVAARAIGSLRALSEEIDQIAKDSIRLGIATDKLQGLERFAALAGSSAGELVSGLSKMEVAISKGAKSFEKLGLNAAALKGMKPEEAFINIAEAMQKMGDPNERMAAVKDIFGKGGASLLPTLLSDNVGGAFGKYGNVTDEQAAAMQQANDAAKELSFAFDNLKTSVVGAAAPLATKLSKTATVLAGGDISTSAWDKTINSMSAKDFDEYAKGIAQNKQTSHGGLAGMFGAGYDQNVQTAERMAAVQARLKREAPALRAKVRADEMQSGLIGGTGMVGIDLGQITAMESAMKQKQRDDIMRNSLQMGMGMMMGSLAQTPDQFAGQQDNLDRVRKQMRSVGKDAAEGVRTNAALEKGSAAAFSQAHRSTESQKMLKTAEDSLKVLREQLKEIKANNKQIVPPVVNI